MARPAKPASVIRLTNDVSHRTKREIAFRAEAEAGNLTGEGMRERADVKEDLTAHKEFMRLRRLFRKIEKDDAIYSQTINDYCILHSQRMTVTAKIAQIDADLDKLEDMQPEMEFLEYLENREKLFKQREKAQDQQLRIMDKMRAIEDKNLMNIQSALRSIPKKPDERKNPLKEALSG